MLPVQDLPIRYSDSNSTHPHPLSTIRLIHYISLNSAHVINNSALGLVQILIHLKILVRLLLLICNKTDRLNLRNSLRHQCGERLNQSHQGLGSSRPHKVVVRHTFICKVMKIKKYIREMRVTHQLAYPASWHPGGEERLPRDRQPRCSPTRYCRIEQ